MLLKDLGPRITTSETLKRVDGRWALVSKHDPKKVLQYYHGNGHPSDEWVKKVERRVHSFESVLQEGGNVFKNKETGEILTQRINQADVEPTVRWLETITGFEHLPHMLGTTGKKATSGDLDIGMPPGAKKEELVDRLSGWCAQHNVDSKTAIKKSGVSVHFRTPIGGAPDRGYVQTDFMFLPNLEFAKFAMSADPQSNFKDSNKHVVMASIAKHKGYKWSPTTGLVNRETNEVLSTDPDKIAKTLLGNTATRGDITSVEKILNALQGNSDAEAILADARETLGREGVTI